MAGVTSVVVCPGCGKRNRVPAAAKGLPRCAACHSPLPWLVQAVDADFDEVAVRSPLPVLVDLWAPWCGPCHAVAPGVEWAARELAGRLKVVKVNVDEAAELAARFDARSIPTLVVLDGGHVVDRRVGALPPDALLSWVTEVVRRRAA